MVAAAGDLREPGSCPCTVPTGRPLPRGGGGRGEARLNRERTAAALEPSNYGVAQCHARPGLQRCHGAAGSSLISARPRGCSQGTPTNPALPPPRCPLPEGPRHGCPLECRACAQKGAAAPWGASTRCQARAADPCQAARRPDATRVAPQGCCQRPSRRQPPFPTHHQRRGLLVPGLLSRRTWGGRCLVRGTRFGGGGDEHRRARAAPSRGTRQLFEEVCATTAVLFAGANLVTAE